MHYRKECSFAVMLQTLAFRGGGSMVRTVRLATGVLVWTSLTYATLSLRFLPGDYSRLYCGAWGCLPPLQAVAAMHGFWVLVVVPPAVWAIRTCPPGTVKAIGLSLLTLGALGIGGVLAWESWTWTHRGSARWTEYLPQRVLAAMITITDFPLLQVFGAGVALRLTVRRDPGKGCDGTDPIELDERRAT
jgi:hypothetical protein